MNSNIYLLVGLIIFLALSALILNTPIKQQITTLTPQIEETKIEVGTLPALGNPQASVKIIEFADFLCPYCALTVAELYPKLENLINQGKVAIYFKDFVVHPEALIIHNAARCVNEENKFWEFNKMVFKEFLDKKETYKKEVLIELAKSLGVNVGNFEKCLDEGRYLKEIQKDFEEAIRLDIKGTPTFFINGKKIEGLNINDILATINSLVK